MNHILKQKKKLQKITSNSSQGVRENLLFGGSVDKKLATCVAEASRPFKSLRASSEISTKSNPGRDRSIKLAFLKV